MEDPYPAAGLAHANSGGFTAAPKFMVKRRSRKGMCALFEEMAKTASLDKGSRSVGNCKVWLESNSWSGLYLFESLAILIWRRSGLKTCADIRRVVFGAHLLRLHTLVFSIGDH